jgi:hypothetical protein
MSRATLSGTPDSKPPHALSHLIFVGVTAGELRCLTRSHFRADTASPAGSRPPSSHLLPSRRVPSYATRTTHTTRTTPTPAPPDLTGWNVSSLPLPLDARQPEGPLRSLPVAILQVLVIPQVSPVLNSRPIGRPIGRPSGHPNGHPNCRPDGPFALMALYS